MNTLTLAEKHDWMLREWGKRYVETRLRIAKEMAAGGRWPGITVPSKEEMQQFFESTTPAYWQALQQTAPDEAQSQLQQWEQAQ